MPIGMRTPMPAEAPTWYGWVTEAAQMTRRTQPPVMDVSGFRVAEVGAAEGVTLPGVQFKTAQEAAEYVAVQKASGQSLRVVRYLAPADVQAAREREYRRLGDGTYRRLPDWFWSLCNFEHFVHWAQDETKASKGWIAYSPDEAALVDDKQLSLPASRYLAKHCSRMSADEISRVFQRLICSLAPVTLHVTRDVATVREAYIGRNHCSESSDHPSCMRYDPAEFHLTDTHPCDAYVGPTATLALAYTKTAEGDIRARAVVAPNSKTFVRVYGYDEVDRQEILRLLNEEGYARADSFEGERLHLEPHPKYASFVVVPYLDGDATSCTSDGVICCDSDGPISCDTTTGRARIHRYLTCDRCDDDFGEDDSDAETIDGETWCPSCVNRHTFFCHGTEWRYISNDYDSVEVREDPRGNYTQTWELSYAEANAFLCERTEVYYDSAQFMAVEVRVADGFETWCLEDSRRHVRETDTGYESKTDFPRDDDPAPHTFRTGDRCRVVIAPGRRHHNYSVGELITVINVHPYQRDIGGLECRRLDGTLSQILCDDEVEFVPAAELPAPPEPTPIGSFQVGDHVVIRQEFGNIYPDYQPSNLAVIEHLIDEPCWRGLSVAIRYLDPVRWRLSYVKPEWLHLVRAAPSEGGF